MRAEREKTPDRGPDCGRCAHYFVTWDAAAPRGCRAYEFKSTRSPAAVILESTGTPCLQFRMSDRPRRD